MLERHWFEKQLDISKDTHSTTFLPLNVFLCSVLKQLLSDFGYFLTDVTLPV